MPFQNDVVGGTTLIRNAINSPNYVPGVSGWTINRDGSAEFANVTTRGPVVVTNPANGQVVATVAANGNISGQLGTFTDVLIGTTSVGAELIARARGIVGYWDIGASALPAPGNGVFTNLAWVRCNFDTSRVYRVTTRLLPVQTTSTTYQILTSQWIYSNNLVSSVTFGTQVQSVPSASFGGTQFPDMFQNIAYFADTRAAANGGRATFLLQTKSTDAKTNFVNGGWGLIIEDIGPLSAVTTFRDGGTGTPSGLTTYTTTYPCTASEIFDGNGNREFISSYMNTGQPAGSSATFPERGMWCFNGTQLRSNLSGATLNWARLYLYCLNSSSTTDGETFVGWLANSTIPGSYPGAGSGTTKYTGWPLPGWAFVDVTSPVGTYVLSGINASSVMQTIGLSTPSCQWSGFTGTYAPYLVLNYTK